MTRFHLSRTPSTLFAALFGLVCVLWATPAAQAQSDSDLRNENQSLKTQVDGLQKELAATREQIKQLEEQVDRLRKQLASRRDGGEKPSETETPLEEEKVSIDESVPQASPRALFNAIEQSYKDEFGEAPDTGATDRERAGFERRLKSWVARVNREMKGQIVWHVRVDRAEPSQRGHALELQAVDPETGTELGEPFEMLLPRNLARRFEQLAERDGESVGGEFILRGVITPVVAVNEDRLERGGFDRPRFVGPMAEFSYTIEPTSLLPVEDEPASTQPNANDNRTRDGGPNRQPTNPDRAKPAPPAKPAEKSDPAKPTPPADPAEKP